MALRLANKINRQVVRNVYRSLSAKRETELEPVIQKTEGQEVTKPVEGPPPILPLNGATIPTQYEVCRPRTTPIAPFPHSVQNETDAAKKTVALQHLQPSMLPEYYKPPVEINAACMYFDPITETDRQATTKYRQFEQSKTCKHVTLPLKGPKLASPFPDPVKVMQSHTISDQEKAEQMLAESKIMKGNSDKSKQKRQPSIRSLPPNRTYSTSSGKCKKIGKPGKKVCPCIKVKGCRPVKNIKCGKPKKARPVCLRKPPPYPSYSETCHEDTYEKPSECKTCPYRPDEHPYFKAPKQDFHTSTVCSLKPKGECTKPPSTDKKPCGWVKEKKNIPNTNQQQEKKPQPKKKAMINLTESLAPPKMPQLDQNLAVNFKPKIFAFLPPKTNEYKEQKKTKKTENSALSTKAEHPSNVTLGGEMGAWLNQLQPEDILPNSREVQLTEADQEPTGKCKKFPFKECTFTIVKERKERVVYNQKCPPKPKRKLTKDCPPDKMDDKCKRSSSVNDVYSYFMADSNNPSEPPKKKCPKHNTDVCKEPHEYTDDPCKRKKRGITQICPSDLLSKKKRKPKKKTSPLIPLAQITRASRSDTAIKI